MARRISTGIVGARLLGNFSAFNNTFGTVEENQDIVLNPNGLGIVQVNSHLQLRNQKGIRFADSDSSNFVEIKAPTNLSENLSLTLPNSTSSGTVLTSDEFGNLSFDAASLSVENQIGDTDTYYPILSTSTNGTISTVTTSDTKLSYQPSSGRLEVDAVKTGSLLDTGDRELTIRDVNNNILWGG
jgi:hypothetical protein